MQSRANAVAEVNVYVPELSYFDRDALLARPVVRDGSLPAAPMDAPTPGLSGKLRLLIGNVGGAVVSSVMSGMTQALGGLAGYRDEVWTNWYRRHTSSAFSHWPTCASGSTGTTSRAPTLRAP